MVEYGFCGGVGGYCVGVLDDVEVFWVGFGVDY